VKSKYPKYKKRGKKHTPPTGKKIFTMSRFVGYNFFQLRKKPADCLLCGKIV